MDTSIPGALVPEHSSDEMHLIEELEMLKRKHYIDLHDQDETLMTYLSSGFYFWWIIYVLVLTTIIGGTMVMVKHFQRVKLARVLRKHVSFSDLNSEDEETSFTEEQPHISKEAETSKSSKN